MSKYKIFTTIFVVVVLLVLYVLISAGNSSTVNYDSTTETQTQ